MAVPALRADYLRANPPPCGGALSVYDIGRFLMKHGMAPSRFGRDAIGDPGFVAALRRGRVVRIETWNRIHDFIASVEG